MENNDDLLFSILENDTEESKTTKIEKDKKLTLEQLKYFENEHWYFKYRTKALKQLITGYIIKKNPKILDIGVGTGTISKMLDEYGDCTHIDCDEEVIKFNKENNNLDIIYGKLPWDLSLEDNYYDYIVLFNILEYINNDKWALNFLKTKLKNDGRIIISTLANPSFYGKNDEFYDIKRRYDLKEIKELLFSIGLSIEYYTFFEKPPLVKQLSETSDKFFDEQKIYWNEIPEDNDKLYEYFINKELPILGIKKIPSGKQLFLVVKKITEEERLKELDKIYKKQNISTFIDYVISKIAKDQ